MTNVPAGARYTVEPLRPQPRRDRRLRHRPEPAQPQRRRSDDWIFGLLLGGWLFGGS